MPSASIEADQSMGNEQVGGKVLSGQIPSFIPKLSDNDSSRRHSKVFGKERAVWRCGASRNVRDAVRKPCYAAVPVVPAARRRASETLTDAPHRPRVFSYPTNRTDDLYGSLSLSFGIRYREVGMLTWSHTLQQFLILLGHYATAKSYKQTTMQPGSAQGSIEIHHPRHHDPSDCNRHDILYDFIQRGGNGFSGIKA